MNLDSFADLMFVQDSEQIVGVADFIIVDANDDVAKFEITHLSLLHSAETCLSGAAATRDLDDEHTVVDR